MGKIYLNENQEMLQKLVELYGADERDWLYFQITRGNFLTVHHILEASKGGILTIDNLALLTKRAHRLLNMCKSRDFILYSDINAFFRLIIARGAFDEYYKKEAKTFKKKLTDKIY